MFMGAAGGQSGNDNVDKRRENATFGEPGRSAGRSQI
jgi:hypothetical protein